VSEMTLGSYSARLAHVARDFLGRNDVGISSAAGLLVFLGWPLLILVLLFLDCTYFPMQHHAINALIGYGV
jgi:hypothetical protein